MGLLFVLNESLNEKKIKKQPRLANIILQNHIIDLILPCSKMHFIQTKHFAVLFHDLK